MDGEIKTVFCDRCNCLVGARRVVNGKVVEEEFEPGVEREGDKAWCAHCIPLKGTFPDIDECLIDLKEVDFDE